MAGEPFWVLKLVPAGLQPGGGFFSSLIHARGLIMI